MLYQPFPPLVRRLLAAFLALLIGLGPLATPAYAALTPLADEPLNIKNQAKPNIVLTIDDSTSMLFDFLPDYVATGLFCRNGLGAGSAACGNIGAVNDFTLVGGGKYSSPGYIFPQYGVPLQQLRDRLRRSPAPAPAATAGLRRPVRPASTRARCPASRSTPRDPQQSWPNSLRPYEYWLMWPPAVHNSALNHCITTRG